MKSGVKEPVEVTPKEESILDMVACIVYVRPDMCNIEDGNVGLAGYAALAAVGCKYLLSELRCLLASFPPDLLVSGFVTSD